MSAPPYWHCGRTVRRQSLMTLAALLPAVIGAVWTWGLPAVRVMSLCVAVAVLTEAACQKLMGRELVSTTTAVCSGLLLSFMLPADAPWWIAVMAPLIAISLGKMAFGGLGANPVNTSVVGWAVLFVSFPLFMEPNAVQLNAASMVDPLVRLKFFGWADAGSIPPAGPAAGPADQRPRRRAGGGRSSWAAPCWRPAASSAGRSPWASLPGWPAWPRSSA